ncbi:hypothetical protein AVEN_190794-1 [Araneus ventricosus]|uniref:Integrase zinc-binding domain-containing protein n=1 Tax=Araneus ventricosus TaxID=182803 RepID=A0A4Y2T3G4_ARAVE|nr:hypothetical protein AVEN_190794-1 [Araneus ventricosus]
MKNPKCKQMKRNVSIQLGEGECIMGIDSGKKYSACDEKKVDFAIDKLLDQGIEKKKSIARCYVWWPNIEEDIANRVGLCEPCKQQDICSCSYVGGDYKAMVKGQTWIPGTVIEKTGLVSHKTVTPDGKSIRCHIDQMRNRKSPLVSAQSSPEIQTASSAIPSSSNTTIKLSDPPAEIETPKEAPGESLLNRPGRNHNSSILF